MHAWIYYYHDQILYYSSYTFNLHTSFDAPPIQEIRYRYFVYTKGKSCGFVNDKYKSEFNKRVAVDSMLKMEWTTQFGFYPFNCNVVFISENKNANTGELHERYSFKGGNNNSMSGTIDLYFSSRLKISEFSLSKELDSMKNMKLYKVYIVNNSRFIKEHNITLDKIEQGWKLEEIPVSNREEILNYFNFDKNSNCLQN